MAEMTILKCDIGSKAATVLCPSCTWISRQILKEAYNNGSSNKLMKTHVCPICGSVYDACNAADANKYRAAFSSYTMNSASYKEIVKDNYSRSQNVKPVPEPPKQEEKKEEPKEQPKEQPKQQTPTPVPVTAQDNSDLNVDQVMEDFVNVVQEISNKKASSEGEDNTVQENISEDIPAPSTPLPPVYQEIIKTPPKPVLSGNPKLDAKIDHWKKELLDTGKRNKMINYKETKRATLKILEPGASELFNLLALQEKELTFQRPISKDSDFRTFSMLALLETFNYSLPVHRGDIKAEGTVLERERTLKNLRAKTKLAQEEQGTNILYLSFGFILWRENNKESTQWVKSPLLMMPAQLGLKSLNAPFTLSKYDDEIEVNPTLDYLFNQDYGIDLPTFELKDKNSFDNYLDNIEEIIDKRGWKLVREVSLGLLSFLKISMYHDLNDNRELMINSPVIQAIAGDRHALGNIPERAINFNFDKENPANWHEVVDSDSSQEEAILLSKMGVSFVMQGPPGTGKSQTITNIIAEALGDGKKVLFVSEKSAALQVVLKRLTDVRLNDFCLTLHNYKANKKEIIEDIGANLRLNTTYVDSSIDTQLTELFHDREFLDEYAEDLHKKLPPFGESVYMVFGKLAKLRDASVVDFKLENPTGISKEEYLSMLYVIDAFEKALRNLDGKLSTNPWADTTAKSADQNFKSEMLSKSEGLGDSMKEVVSIVEAINEAYGTSIKVTWNGVSEAIIVLDNMLSLPLFPMDWWSEDRRKLLRERAFKEEGIDQAEQGHARKLSGLVKKTKEGWNVDVFELSAKSLAETFADESRWVGENRPATMLECNEQYIKNLETTKSILNELADNYRNAKSLLKLSLSDNLPALVIASKILSLAADAPDMQADWFDVRKNSDYISAIDEIKFHQQAVVTKCEKVLASWDEDVLKLDTDSMLGRFKTEYSGLLYKLKSSYKEDIKQIKLLSKNVGIQVSEDDVIALLQQVEEINDEKKWFTDNESKFKPLFGDAYVGYETDCDKITEGVNTANEIANQFPYANIPAEVISAVQNITSGIQQAAEARRLADLLKLEAINESAEVLKNAGLISGLEDEASITEKLLTDITERIEVEQTSKKLIEQLDNSVATDKVTYEQLKEIITDAGLIQQECIWFKDNIPDIASELNIESFNDSDTVKTQIHNAELILKNHDAIAEADETEELTSLFGNRYTGNFTDWQQVVMDIDSVDVFVKGGVDESLKGFIEKACNDEAMRQQATNDLSRLKSLVDSSESKFEYFDELFPKSSMKDMSLSDIADKYQTCLNNFSELNKWLDYVETRSDCDKKGLSDFTAKIAALDNSIRDVKAAFERGFYSQWLNLAVNDVGAVQTFKKRAHEQKLSQFVKLDKKQFEFSVDRIRNSVISRFPDRNAVTDAHSEVRILEHEMEKKRRVMPLRRLFHEIPGLLTTLKPCFMMSPLSVAYFLDAKDYHFDMVIFDEASQIFPQDAIGAIFRADQVIIAGDTKQLPPTSFFSSSTSNNDDFDDNSEENWEEENFDSILEETANVLPNRTLLWHYRSKHEHLIAFSNNQIYRVELVTFPSSNESEPDAGVEFEYVEGGYYEGGGKNCNKLEAQRCVELVKEHIDKHPERSLGIIAFSEKQQQAISTEIQRFREANPKYEKFFAEDKDDEFFVKNLENVQGDERDTIIFSICYAKTQEQIKLGKPMSLRFGPLGLSGGERRLNVAITRAKRNIKLVTSIMPSDVNLANTNSDGIKMLVAYLEFAKNSGATLAASNKDRAADDFVYAIADFIKSKGYKVRQYVGCSDYKIDIAVEHPEVEGEYIAGIECDGNSYASARTARDRDRLRGSVLSSMGWRMYRVWSTEWYRNPEFESQKLLEFIEKALEDSNKKLQSINKDAEAKNKKLQEEAEKERIAKEQKEIKRQMAEEELAEAARARREQQEAEAKKKAQEAAKRRAEEEARRVQKPQPAPQPKPKPPKQPQPKPQPQPRPATGQKDIFGELLANGFECIDNRATSNIIWVIFDKELKETFEQILNNYSNRASFSREKRGSMTTGGRDAWRIMIH